MRKLSLLSGALMLMLSCSDKKETPKNILPKEKMQEVLWSMINAGEFLNTYVLNKDSVDKVLASSKVYGQVFQIHHITKETFEKSYLYYREHPDVMKVMLDSLSKKQTYTVEKFQKLRDTISRKISRHADVK